MDETDMADSGSQPASGQTAATGIEAPPAAPVPQQRETEVESHFSTPSWLDPGGGTVVPRVVPTQPTAQTADPVPMAPTHPYAPAAADKPFIEQGHWVESTPPRRIAGTVLVLSLVGLVGSLIAAITTQSVIAIAAAALCAVIAVVFRSALISTGVTTVDLKGSRLTVFRDGVHDEFNLVDPTHPVEIVGSPGDPGWRVLLDTVDGRTVEVTAAQVDAAELHPAIEHYRSLAARERADRERRFNR
jgi:hypothetical protein